MPRMNLAKLLVFIHLGSDFLNFTETIFGVRHSTILKKFLSSLGDSYEKDSSQKECGPDPAIPHLSTPHLDGRKKTIHNTVSRSSCNSNIVFRHDWFRNSRTAKFLCPIVPKS